MNNPARLREDIATLTREIITGIDAYIDDSRFTAKQLSKLRRERERLEAVVLKCETAALESEQTNNMGEDNDDYSL